VAEAVVPSHELCGIVGGDETDFLLILEGR
jgi:hypothetical protein